MCATRSRNTCPGPPPLDPRRGPAETTRFLSQGSYTVLVTSAGTGFSFVGPHALTVWRHDALEDPDGLFIYLRDLQDGRFWLLGHRRAISATDEYAARWQPGKFTLTQKHGDLEAELEIGVACDAAAELRRLTLHNRGKRPRRIEATTFLEVALSPARAHAAHPAFSKLFVQTEFLPDVAGLLARRRPRAATEHHPWMIHAWLDGQVSEYESDRVRFIGRGGSLAAPRALVSKQPLTGTTGGVLDPAMSLRRVFFLPPGAYQRATFVLGADESRAGTLDIARRFATPESVEHALRLAQSAAERDLERLDLTTSEAEYFQMLAGAVLYGHPELRARPEVLARACGSVSALSRHGLSPHHAWAVLHADRPGGEALRPTLEKAHRYWQSLGLPIDLVILEKKSRSRNVSATPAAPGAPARRVQLPARNLPASDLDLLDAAARLVITDALPNFASTPEPASAVTSADGARPAASEVLPRSLSAERPSSPAVCQSKSRERLRFFNGRGGFLSEGQAYAIELPLGGEMGIELPPRPWVNIMANAGLGTLLSETGAASTWSGNSREHPLTPWSNDPLLDPHGEALYVRDDEDGTFWSPLPGPAPAGAGYEMRHGLGYSECCHAGPGLEERTTVFVAGLDPVKVTTWRMVNRSPRPRRLSLFAYCRLALAASSEEAGRSVVTELTEDRRAILVRNRLAEGFHDHVAFAAVGTSAHAVATHATGDRAAFIGQWGCPARPAALLERAVLDDRTGPGLDPCAAHQVMLALEPGESAEVHFLLGEARDAEEARALIRRYQAPGVVAQALGQVQSFWRELAAVRVKTPSPALDLLVNSWLPYQILSCRLWGRTAFYQSSGAFGYRDQLQDAAALVWVRPDLTREQLLLHAAHQFAEGDVLHWWHPPRDYGLRSRCSDDLLWLPHLTAHYAQVTGDWAILDERVPFLTAPALEPGEDEKLVLPAQSDEVGSLYDHCCRALDRSLRTGERGLPLMGTGDWNDGMNRVGRGGRGESVWLGFFLVTILDQFVAVCRRYGDHPREVRYTAQRDRLCVALNTAGWDGEWYRRGYYNDGQPLGSKASDECRIDALAQAWAVLSRVAPPDRAAQAMDAAERHLVSQEEGLIRLLTPPFDDGPQDPGYIKGYVPGIRENGGQYTHAALWVVQAMAALGRRDRVAAWLDMINPVHHARDAAAVSIYQVEPYVVAGDVYGAPPYVGRGGWTWYTGAAGWMYRVALESLLGLGMMGGDTLRVRPCVPDHWPGFRVDYRLPGTATCYEIRVSNPTRCSQEVVAAACDGETLLVEDGACRISLVRDGGIHRVKITLGRPAARAPRSS